MNANPYEAANTPGQQAVPYRRLSLTPIKYMQRAYRMIKAQYLLFLGVTFCGLLIGSIAPFGILLGPMLTGVYLCFLEKESGSTAKFETLFRGFEHFIPSFLVMLTAMLCNFIVTVTLVAITIITGFFLLPTAGNAFGNSVPVSFVAIGFAAAYSVLMLASFLAFVPFAFCFQLIAEHKMSAGDAMRASTRAAMHNLFPLVAIYLCLSFFGFVAALFCYVPLFLLMPIQLGSTFILYRDTFPRLDDDAAGLPFPSND